MTSEKFFNLYLKKFFSKAQKSFSSVHSTLKSLCLRLKTLMSQTEHKLKDKNKGEIRIEKKVLSKRDLLCGNIIEYGILAVIIFSPLPKASVHEWSILIIQSMVLVMMAAYIFMREKPQNNKLLSSSLKWPRYLFLGFFIFILIQVLPWPKFFAKLLSPRTYSFREVFSPDFSKAEFTSFTLVPSQTVKEGLELLSYFLLGFLILKTVTKRRQIMRIFYVLVAMGVFQAFYGFYELFNNNPRILFYKKIYNLDSVTGTFVNRNHLSGYLEMVVPLALGLIVARIDLFSLAGLKLRERILRLSEKKFYIPLLLSLGVVVISLAIIFSKSRSGVFLLILTFILFFQMIVFYVGREKGRERRIKTFFKILFLFITFFALLLGIDAIIERFALDKVLQENRPLFWRNTTQIVGDYPLFGSGLGTFSSVYPAYEKTQTTSHLSHVHNDYLEYLSELGGVGLALLLAGILFMLVNSFLIWRERRHPEVKGLALGGMIAVVGILVHCIVDFNLHIPANMALFSIVLSLTMVTAFYKREETGQPEKTSVTESAHRIMPNLKRAFLTATIIVLFLVNICIYWNAHLSYAEEKIEGMEEKIKLLERANRFYPLNDLVFYKLGKNYFDLGIQSLDQDKTPSANYLQKSIQNFERSLRLNPASRFSHFYYAQSFLYASYLLPSFEERYYDEYKKAALLAGHNSEIFFEVGKIFLSRWPRLSDENREFTLETWKKIIGGEDKIKLQALMHIWAMSIKDYTVMQGLLPEDIQTYRTYAQFLGEQSLSLEERRWILAKAEYLEFRNAKTEYKLGENAFVYLRVRQASKHFRSCLDRLDRVNFYQNLTESRLIDPLEFNELRKQGCLKLAKCHLRQGRRLNEVEDLLRAYLELEESPANVAELEFDLKKLRLIRPKLDDDLNDLDLLSFQILLYFKQNRYMDIIKTGNILQKGYIFVPESKQKNYLEVLQLIGDSYQKVDYLYDAANFYLKALEVDPDNLKILMSLRTSYERLNKTQEAKKISASIENLLSPREIDYKNLLINRGKSLSRMLNLDGRKMALSIYFRAAEEKITPLISIFFNGKVVWENYLKDGAVLIPLETRIGENSLVVLAVNSPVNVAKLKFEAEKERSHIGE